PSPGARAWRGRGRPEGNTPARHGAADRRSVHRHEDARATAAVGGPLADVDSGPAHGAMHPWIVLRPAGRATRRVPVVRAGPGVSYRMISAVVRWTRRCPPYEGPRPRRAVPRRWRLAAVAVT